MPFQLCSSRKLQINCMLLVRNWAGHTESHEEGEEKEEHPRTTAAYSAMPLLHWWTYAIRVHNRDRDRTALASAAHVETSTSTTFAILKPLFRIKNDTCFLIQISFGPSSHMAPSSSTSLAHQMLFCSRVNVRNFSTASSSIWPARVFRFCAQHTHTDVMARQPIIVMILSNEIQSLFSISGRFKVTACTHIHR